MRIGKRSSKEKPLIPFGVPLHSGRPAGPPLVYGRIWMGTDVTVSEPVAVRHRSRRTQLKKKNLTRPNQRGAPGPTSGTFLASACLIGVCAGQVPFLWLLGVLPKLVIGWVRIG